MEQEDLLRVINILYYLYFGKYEVVHYYEIEWTPDGMSSRDIEYAYVFLGWRNPYFNITLDDFYFFYDNQIIEEDSGSEHSTSYILTEYYRIYLGTILSDKNKEEWEKQRAQAQTIKDITDK